MGIEGCDALDELVNSGLLDKNIRNGTAIYSSPRSRKYAAQLSPSPLPSPHLFLIRKYLKKGGAELHGVTQEPPPLLTTTTT